MNPDRSVKPGFKKIRSGKSPENRPISRLRDKLFAARGFLRQNQQNTAAVIFYHFRAIPGQAVFNGKRSISGNGGIEGIIVTNLAENLRENTVISNSTHGTGCDTGNNIYDREALKFSPRSFLLLEGPPGSFFRELGWRLRSLGYETSFLNLSGGDALERLSFLSLLRDFLPAGSLREYLIRGKRIPENVLFRKSPDRLPLFLRGFIRERAVTDLLLYDRGLPWYRAVQSVAQECGIRLWVFADAAEFPGGLLLDAVLPGGSTRLERLLSDELLAFKGSSEDIGKELTAADIAAADRVMAEIKEFLRAPRGFRRPETLRHRIGNLLLAPFFSCSSDSSQDPFPEDAVCRAPQEGEDGAFLRDTVLQLVRDHALVPGDFRTRAGVRKALQKSLELLGLGGIRHCIIFSAPIAAITGIQIFLDGADRPAAAGWGHKPTADRARRYARRHGIPYYALEDGFIKSVATAFRGRDEKTVSLVLDRTGIYYDVFSDSELEDIMIRSPEWFTPELASRARKLREFITAHEIVKYNARGERDEQNDGNKGEGESAERTGNAEPGTRENVSEPRSIPAVTGALSDNIPEDAILVIDQTFNDASVPLGNASPETFREMLSEAVNKAGADHVYVKVHPNVVAGLGRGYFPMKILKKQGVHVIAAAVNAFKLLKRFRNVYTVTSGTGLEALMQGCRVTCFGEPFYSGYGLTIDKKTLASRKRLARMKEPASLELLVAAVFFRYCIFIDPDKSRPCSPEEALRYILAARDGPEALKESPVPSPESSPASSYLQDH